MKKTIMAIMAIISFGLNSRAQDIQDTTTKKEGIQTIRIKTSAVCDMCKETLERAMAYEKGVKESMLDVNTKILTVKYDAKKTSPEKIRKAVALAGYDADDIPADSGAYEKLHACCKKDVQH